MKVKIRQDYQELDDKLKNVRRTLTMIRDVKPLLGQRLNQALDDVEAVQSHLANADFVQVECSDLKDLLELLQCADSFSGQGSSRILGRFSELFRKNKKLLKARGMIIRRQRFKPLDKPDSAT